MACFLRGKVTGYHVFVFRLIMGLVTQEAHGEATSKWTGRCRAFVGSGASVVEVKVFVSTKATSGITLTGPSMFVN